MLERSRKKYWLIFLDRRTTVLFIRNESKKKTNTDVHPKVARHPIGLASSLSKRRPWEWPFVESTNRIECGRIGRVAQLVTRDAAAASIYRRRFEFPASTDGFTADRF